MSRIDQALRAWEKKEDVSRQPERFELGKYTHENGTAVRTPAQKGRPVAPPSVAVPQPIAHAPVAAQPRVRSQVSRPVNPDIEARLVTGPSGAVPLEQYRRLAAVLHELQRQQGLKTLMVTSSLPAEGKTLTTINLALTLSESYARRVLVVDADLRWPSVHSVLGLPNDSGLSEALSNGTEPTIQLVSSRLSVLTGGSPGVAPLAGLTSSRMTELIDRWAAQFDWVIIDTPPVGLLPDAQLLARQTRAVVFVIGAGITPAATVERAIGDLGPECVIGTVLNRVDDHHIPESGYYSRYGYGYSSDSDVNES